MIKVKSILAGVLIFSLIGCGSGTEPVDPTKQKEDSIRAELASLPTWKTPIRQMSDDSYPDNPDIEIRHQFYDHPVYKDVLIRKRKDGTYDIVAKPKTEDTDSLFINNINIMEFIPLAVERVRGDDYATYISIINQEWNRHQVRFGPEQFKLEGGKEKQQITRVDVARNCLNAYLWELIIYAKEGEEEKPYYHGWFDFPKDLYADLFDERNAGKTAESGGVKFADYSKYLVDWVTPENKFLDMNLLRKVDKEEEIEFESHNHKLYPIIGERKKKQKNIISPKKVKNIDDFLHDYTRYATFTPPGYYNTADPRPTELSRFANPDLLKLNRVTATNPSKTKSYEVEMHFERRSDNLKTKLVIGGLEPSKIPTLATKEAHKGWQMSMGIANHSFYESYEIQQANPAADNPFYAVLLDENGNWLDSHMIGTDGPLFHYDEKNENLVHMWLLSFERHSFVGHFTFEMPKEMAGTEG